MTLNLNKHMLRIYRALIGLAIVAGITSCGGEVSSVSESQSAKLAATAVTVLPTADLKVVTLTKMSETRVSRTVFDYVFQVTIKNTGTDAHTGVVANLTGVGSGTMILDGTVLAARIAANSSVTPADTITLRHDRAFVFAQSALSWQVSANPPVTSAPGTLIIGAPGSIAVSLLHEYAAPRTQMDLVTAIDPVSNAEFYSKELQAVIRATATVQQVNAALTAVGARIAFSQLKNPVVSLQLPSPGDAATLDTIASSLMASGAFDTVDRILIPQTLALPSNVTPAEANDASGTVNLLHQTAARVAAAWPGPLFDTSAFHSEVEVIVVDKFGAGATAAFLQALSGTANSADFAVTASEAHGYHVLGIVAGSFGGSSSAIDKVTGVLPINTPLHAIDLAVPAGSPNKAYFLTIGGIQVAVNYFDFMKARIKSIILKNPWKRFVINISLGYCNGTVNSKPSCPEYADSTVNGHALGWRKFTDNIWPLLPTTQPFDYQGQVIQVSAAGNNNGRRAAKASYWNASALTVLTDGTGPLPPLRNGLVVENRQLALPLVSGQRPTPACLSNSSNIDGNIGAIGTNVFSFTGVSTTGFMSGTSMAAPQVAGLAAWLLTVRPTLDSTALINTFKNTAYAPSATTPDPCAGKPMIDAFAALLNLDTASGENTFDAPTRLRLLQPNAAVVGKVFNIVHAKEFLQHIFPTAYPPAPPAPIEATFSPFDLNGDGFIGDPSKRAPFDLKFDHSGGQSPSYDLLTQYPNATKISLDEKSVSDFEVLCYYVNSSLFDPAGLNDFETELAAISRNVVPARRISCNERTVNLYVNTTFPNWELLPAKIILSNFSPTFPATSAGNSATCANQGEPPGERGTPLFSSFVPKAVPISAAIDVLGVPTQSGRVSNRRNCSSFFATNGAQVWINATARAVFGFGGSVVSDWEYQVRYSNGDPNNNNLGKQCVVGTVPGSGVFLASFNSSACSHDQSGKIME